MIRSLTKSRKLAYSWLLHHPPYPLDHYVVWIIFPHSWKYHLIFIFQWLTNGDTIKSNLLSTGFRALYNLTNITHPALLLTSTLRRSHTKPLSFLNEPGFLILLGLHAYYYFFLECSPPMQPPPAPACPSPIKRIHLSNFHLNMIFVNLSLLS